MSLRLAKRSPSPWPSPPGEGIAKGAPGLSGAIGYGDCAGRITSAIENEFDTKEIKEVKNNTPIKSHECECEY